MRKSGCLVFGAAGVFLSDGDLGQWFPDNDTIWLCVEIGRSGRREIGPFYPLFGVFI